MSNPPTTPVLSVVIPALNEAAGIVHTLDRLAAQDSIHEIIVVDNGSTDGTRRIVAEYSINQPKVVLIEELRRGVARARNTGFDKARGDFIGRTDADTLVAPDWGEVITRHLTEHPDTAAVTGITTYYDSPVGFFLEFGYYLQQRRGKLGGRVGNMHGPNMAIRRTAWEKVRTETTTRPDVIDDLDLALCLTKNDLVIDQLTHMRAETSARRRRTSPRRWWGFQLAGLRTITSQGYTVHPFHRAVIVGAWLTHTIQWPIYRLWDFDRRRFTLRPNAAREFPLSN
ncbi:glycosyltransferase family 2 protein [Nocardia amamiensis]|uniref:Glycosyltransferase family 2 protein n=1 Tax=Nocardia amamiensis TaxID=404578 RepID=A0ABS0D6E9_9NOCA|nr:glycosyltransferase family 2 protein [Nocardia amamiensis]MBF6302729.1 glycosyltransferase family 2 protein [Nocardia amamiensis]